MTNDIALDALNDLNENAVNLPADRIAEAEEYAKEALIALESATTYPYTWSPHLARESAIVYVKFKIMGMSPVNRPEWMNTVNAFRIGAARGRSRWRSRRNTVPPTK